MANEVIIMIDAASGLELDAGSLGRRCVRWSMRACDLQATRSRYGLNVLLQLIKIAPDLLSSIHVGNAALLALRRLSHLLTETVKGALCAWAPLPIHPQFFLPLTGGKLAESWALLVLILGMNTRQSVWVPFSNKPSWCWFISTIIDEVDGSNLLICMDANDLLPLPWHAAMRPYGRLETPTTYIMTLSEEFHALLKESLWLVDLLQVLYVTLYPQYLTYSLVRCWFSWWSIGRATSVFHQDMFDLLLPFLWYSLLSTVSAVGTWLPWTLEEAKLSSRCCALEDLID